MVVSIRDQSQKMLESLQSPPSCEICGDSKFSIGEEDVGVSVERYRTVCCRRGCEGMLCFTYILVEAAGDLGLAREDFIGVECSVCEGPERGLHDLIERHGPIEEEEYRLPVDQILTVDIHEHHISYEPEETILLCSKCHGKVHNSDGFHDGLKPEISRKKWQQTRGGDTR